MATQPDVSPGKRGRRRDGSPWRTWDRWQWPALLVIAAVAAVADAWDMTSDGLEVYYAAGVRSMAGNWHAFLYDSFDPSRGITLDKLPGPFWVQALSVRAFGMSVWAMVLPQIVWSVLTVVVLFLAVRRVAGPVTGLTAAAILAISPATILSAHGNLGDPLFVLLSVLAADAALRAVQGRGWWLALAAVWAGLAFQEKMTEAWLLAAVLAVVYLVAGPAGLRRRRARLAAATSVLAVVSLAWLVFMSIYRSPPAGRSRRAPRRPSRRGSRTPATTARSSGR